MAFNKMISILYLHEIIWFCTNIEGIRIQRGWQLMVEEEEENPVGLPTSKDREG